MVRFSDEVTNARLVSQAVWVVVWLGITLFGLFMRPDPELHGTHQQLGLPPCPSVLLFDRPCFGCGMTTSFTAMTHVDLVTAWKAHPFGPVMYLALTITAAVCLWAVFKRKFVDTNTIAFHRASITFLVVFVCFGVVRFATTTYGSADYELAKKIEQLSGGEKGR